MLTVTLTINDDEQTHTIEPRTVLADLLRDQCGLTGTHLGCEHGACGACTLEVDGKATRSCVVLAVMCEGRSVRTIEGLRDDKIMEVLRRHFHELHGVQCARHPPAAPQAERKDHPARAQWPGLPLHRLRQYRRRHRCGRRRTRSGSLRMSFLRQQSSLKGKC
jgi:hypothetical protein